MRASHSIWQVQCGVRGALCAAACVVLGAACVVLSAQQAPPPVLSVEAALDAYAARNFERAVTGRPFDGLDVASVIGRLDRWVGPVEGADPAVRVQRQQAAARFAVDVVASRDDNVLWFGIPMGDGRWTAPNVFRVPDDGQHRPWPPRFPDQAFALPLVAWACEQMPKAGPVELWEPWWWITSIAVLQGSGEWGGLMSHRGVVYSNKAPAPWEAALRREVHDGHLAHARARLGSHPRLRLAEAVTRASALTDATNRFTAGATARGLSVWGRYDVLRNLEDAASRINHGPLTDVERELAALIDEPGFEGEVALHIAYLRLHRRDWALALRWLDRASAALKEDVLLAAADYFRGWIFERTKRPADALSAYRAAYARYPRSPNLNTLLAAQLMLAGERTEAARILEAPMHEGYNVAWRDLSMLVLSGDSRHARSYAVAMRRAQ